MPRNGTGTYSLPQAPFVAGTTISSAAVNSDLSDIATALTSSLPRDGQAGMTGALLAASGSSVTPSIAFNNDEASGFFLPSVGVIGVVIGGTEIGTFSSTGASFKVTSGVPVGTVVDFMGPTAPALWYLCYGQAVSRTTYSVLFGIIGTTYGSGDGVTTFNLPDLRGTVIAGLDNMGGTGANRLTSTFFGADATILGDRGGLQSGTIVAANLPPYTPTGSVSISVTTAIGQSLILQGGGGSFSGFVVNGQGNQGNNLNIINSESSNFTGTPAPGQTSTALPIVQPTMVVNKIIFAGA